MAILEILADVFVIQRLCSYIKNVPANTVGIIIEIQWRIVFMQIMVKYITSRQRIEMSEGVW